MAARRPLRAAARVLRDGLLVLLALAMLVGALLLTAGQERDRHE
jgi:hypothetical protein